MVVLINFTADTIITAVTKKTLPEARHPSLMFTHLIQIIIIIIILSKPQQISDAYKIHSHCTIVMNGETGCRDPLQLLFHVILLN